MRLRRRARSRGTWIRVSSFLFLPLDFFGEDFLGPRSRWEEKGTSRELTFFGLGLGAKTEMAIRASFTDFVLGLLNLDPIKRWSPQQAMLHPFITGEKFTGPFDVSCNERTFSLLFVVAFRCFLTSFLSSLLFSTLAASTSPVSPSAVGLDAAAAATTRFSASAAASRSETTLRRTRR